MLKEMEREVAVLVCVVVPYVYCLLLTRKEMYLLGMSIVSKRIRAVGTKAATTLAFCFINSAAAAAAVPKRASPPGHHWTDHPLQQQQRRSCLAPIFRYSYSTRRQGPLVGRGAPLENREASRGPPGPIVTETTPGTESKKLFSPSHQDGHSCGSPMGGPSRGAPQEAPDIPEPAAAARDARAAAAAAGDPRAKRGYELSRPAAAAAAAAAAAIFAVAAPRLVVSVGLRCSTAVGAAA